nr:MAG TPA: hypothetical protein [Caudoviricetes sp.]
MPRYKVSIPIRDWLLAPFTNHSEISLVISFLQESLLVATRTLTSSYRYVSIPSQQTTLLVFSKV